MGHPHKDNEKLLQKVERKMHVRVFVLGGVRLRFSVFFFVRVAVRSVGWCSACVGQLAVGWTVVFVFLCFFCFSFGCFLFRLLFFSFVRGWFVFLRLSGRSAAARLLSGRVPVGWALGVFVVFLVGVLACACVW